MTLKDFRDLLQQHGKEIEDLTRRRMPVIAGQLAVSHFKDNFRKSGFVNNGMQSWELFMTSKIQFLNHLK